MSSTTATSTSTLPNSTPVRSDAASQAIRARKQRLENRQHSTSIRQTEHSADNPEWQKVSEALDGFLSETLGDSRFTVYNGAVIKHLHDGVRRSFDGMYLPGSTMELGNLDVDTMETDDSFGYFAKYSLLSTEQDGKRSKKYFTSRAEGKKTSEWSERCLFPGSSVGDSPSRHSNGKEKLRGVLNGASSMTAAA